MCRIIWVAWIVLLLVVSGCSKDSTSPSDTNQKDPESSPAADPTGDAPTKPDGDSEPAKPDPNASQPQCTETTEQKTDPVKYDGSKSA